MILRAARSCFLVRNEPLTDKQSIIRTGSDWQVLINTSKWAFSLHCSPVVINTCLQLRFWYWSGPPGVIDEVLLDLGVVACGPPGPPLQPLVLLVAAVVLLDEDRRPPALLEPLLLVVGPELGLDQDGRLGHLLVESILGGAETNNLFIDHTCDSSYPPPAHTTRQWRLKCLYEDIWSLLSTMCLFHRKDTQHDVEQGCLTHSRPAATCCPLWCPGRRTSKIIASHTHTHTQWLHTTSGPLHYLQSYPC